ncbi:hypothetical protein B0H10DRAFT_390388 [Mycena sp. CBHHK59/15]|nr:hypothetical protein B0H10DRAFT_390388 [Mycena sp. CBHHK59/15]
MLRASSLGFVLYPARFARPKCQLVQSISTKAPHVRPVAQPDGDELPNEPSNKEYCRVPSSFMSSTGTTQLGDVEDLATTSHGVGSRPESSAPPRESVGFQLPSAVDYPKQRPSVPLYFVKKIPAYPAGKPWRQLPLPLLQPTLLRPGSSVLPGHADAQFYDDPFDDLDFSLLFDVERSQHLGVDSVAWHHSLLRVLGNTQSPQQAWMAYYTLVSASFTIPYPQLDRLVHLIARATPKTRTQFHRLLSVLTSIHQSGQKITKHQWNALIDHAGKGLRKARPEDFKLAFDMFTDMVSGKAPGHALSELGYSLDDVTTDTPLPNIVTYNILVNHAANTHTRSALSHSTSLLTASGLPPSRITHLALLKYYANTDQLAGVRASLLKMHEQGLELGLDGVNACMWAFSRNRRLDIAMKLYRIIRHNVTPEVHIGPDDVYSAKRSLLEEGIVVRSDMIPNEVTFTTMIQIMAYHGNLNAALTAFMDMLSSDNVEIGAPLYRDEHGKLRPSPYSPTLPVFRGLFLGFSRHGVNKAEPDDISQLSINKPQQWVLRNLNSLFEVFLALPEYIRPNTSTIYWAMIAFDRTSNHDIVLLQTIWNRIESRFGGPWAASQHRLAKMRKALFDLEAPAFPSTRSRRVD